MFFEVAEAQHVGEYMIKLRFDDGSTGTADLSSYAEKDTVFRVFLDKDYFKSFRIEYGTLVWGDGEIDIAPETLYTLATGKPVRYRYIESKAI